MGKKAVVDLRQVVAQNLLSLMAYAVVHGEERLGTLRGIQDATGGAVTKSTIDRVLKQQSGISIDNLAPLAHVFGVQPWHLLYAELDPSNPPALAVSETERDLYERFRQMAVELRRPHGEQADAGTVAGVDRDPASKAGSKKEQGAKPRRKTRT